MVYLVQGVEYRFPWRSSWAGEAGEPGPLVRREPMQVALLRERTLQQRRGRGMCLDRQSCEAVVSKRKRKQELRAKLPTDAVIKGRGHAERGVCRYCGDPVYRLDKNGNVRPDMRSWWHKGRVIHPDAEAEPNCLGEYNKQGFTFRDQVFVRDQGVCAGCGRDCQAEEEAWRARMPSKAWDADDAADWYDLEYEERDRQHRAWLAEEPGGWQADHIVPLEDDGEHTLANAQTLCSGCHTVKTAAENSARAARRRGDRPDVAIEAPQLGLGC